MSCIVGIAENGKVWMGADSAGVGPNGELQLRSDPKIWKAHDLLIGACGDPKFWQIIRYWDWFGRVDSPTLDGFCWAVFKLLPRLKAEFPEDADFELLIGRKGRLFHVYGTRQVSEELAGYDAAGSGAQVARGAMHATSLVLPAEQIEFALAAAERFCSTVRRPWVILGSE